MESPDPTDPINKQEILTTRIKQIGNLGSAAIIYKNNINRRVKNIWFAPDTGNRLLCQKLQRSQNV